MKSIIISEGNRPRIEKAIEEAQARAKERLIDYSDITIAIERIEKKLNITKKALEGTSASIDRHAQRFPNAYKYTPQSTQFAIFFRGGKWRLANVSRRKVMGENHQFDLTLSETAKTEMLENAKRLK